MPEAYIPEEALLRSWMQKEDLLLSIFFFGESLFYVVLSFIKNSFKCTMYFDHI